VICRTGTYSPEYKESWGPGEVGCRNDYIDNNSESQWVKSSYTAICIVPAANRTLKAVQQIYVNLWNAKFKNKILGGNG